MIIKCPHCGNKADTDKGTNGLYYCPICQRDFYFDDNMSYGHNVERIYGKHKYIDTTVKSIEIECDTIFLRQKDLDITVDLSSVIDEIGSITINGNKFVRKNNA